MSENDPWFKKKEIRLTFHFREFNPLTDVVWHVTCLIITVVCAAFLIYRSSSVFTALIYILLAAFGISFILRVLRSSLKRYQEREQE